MIIIYAKMSYELLGKSLNQKCVSTYLLLGFRPQIYTLQEIYI